MTIMANIYCRRISCLLFKSSLKQLIKDRWLHVSVTPFCNLSKPNADVLILLSNNNRKFTYFATKFYPELNKNVV